MGVVLGIDVSTTATKAVVLDETGAVLAIGTSGLRVRAAAAAVERAGPAPVVGRAPGRRSGRRSPRRACRRTRSTGVGLTGQMHGLVLLDDAGEVLRPAILWNDQRTAAECDAIRAAVGPERLVEITGNDALTGFTAPKLAWVRAHEPDVWRAGRPRAAAQGLRAPPADRRLRAGQGRWRRHAAVRPRGARLVAGDARRAGDRPGVDAADVRGAGGDRHGHRGGGRGDRPARRDAGRWPAAGTRRPTRSGSGPWCPGASRCRWGPRAWCSRRPTARCSSRRGASTRSATPCPAGGT